MSSISKCIEEVARILKEDGVVFEHSTPLTYRVMGGGADLHKHKEEIKGILGENFISHSFEIQTYYKDGKSSKEYSSVYYAPSIFEEINGEGISTNKLKDLMQNFYNSIKL